MTQKELAEKAWDMVATSPIDVLASLNASVIARILDVSLPNLSRAFHNHFGFTLNYFLRSEKYSVFNSLMKKDNKLTSKKVLDMLDIRSHSNFCKGYKNLIGCSPGKYAELIRFPKSREKQVAMA